MPHLYQIIPSVKQAFYIDIKQEETIHKELNENRHNRWNTGLMQNRYREIYDKVNKLSADIQPLSTRNPSELHGTP